MKAYVKRYSFRPGCPCCNTSDYHGFNARKTDTVKRAQRSGRKAQRQNGKREMETWLSTNQIAT